MSPLEREQVVCAGTSALERQIDEMVRAGRPLHDLTPDEIAIVEGK